MNTLRPLVLIGVASLVLAACTPKGPEEPRPAPLPRITVSRELAYDLPEDSVRAAYRAALEQRGLAVRDDDGGSLHATIPPAEMPGSVRVDFRPSDTLTTRVAIAYTYRVVGSDFYHYPYRIPVEASRHLDRTRPVIQYRQALFPPGATDCPTPTPLSSAARPEEPRILPGPHDVQRRVRYPAEARAAGIQGVVHLMAVVTDEGTVPCVEVLSGLPHGLSTAAAQALLQARFAPARLNGRAIARTVVLPIKFLLGN